MLTVKIIRNDGVVQLSSHEEVIFFGAESDAFGDLLDSAQIEANDSGEIPVWGFINCSSGSITPLYFGYKFYVTDMSGKTVFAQEAVLSEPVGDTVN